MNINSVFNTTRPISLYTKENDRRDTSFLDALAQNVKGAYAQQTSGTSGTWQIKTKLSEASYDLTDEEIEYFREKYGENYNEDTIKDIFYELADKGIISMDDASKSSGYSWVLPLSCVKSITYMGTGQSWGLEKYLTNSTRDFNFARDRILIKDVSRTDKDSPYKILWDNFKKTYDREINTWMDALQETIDFERYVKENRNTSDHVFQQHRDQIIEGLEKTREVISRIFG